MSCMFKVSDRTYVPSLLTFSFGAKQEYLVFRAIVAGCPDPCSQCMLGVSVCRASVTGRA